MKNTIALLSFAAATLCASAFAFAQMPDFGKAEQLAEMKKLDWMIGEWKGTGTSQMGPGQSGTSQVHEEIEKRLDGLALLVEGVGMRRNAEGADTKVHHAMAVLRWSPACKCYRLMSQTMHGSFVDAEMRVMPDASVVWGFKTGAAEMRYTIRHTDKDQGHEVGEMNRDGKDWVKIFEMTLDRAR